MVSKKQDVPDIEQAWTTYPADNVTLADSRRSDVGRLVGLSDHKIVGLSTTDSRSKHIDLKIFLQNVSDDKTIGPVFITRKN